MHPETLYIYIYIYIYLATYQLKGEWFDLPDPELRLDVNKTSGSPLFDAVKANKKSVVEALLTHGAAVNTSGWMSYRIVPGWRGCPFFPKLIEGVAV